MMDLRAALADATARLAPHSDTPRLDAELLMAHALGITRETLLLNHGQLAPPPGFATLMDRRMADEPIAYILGQRDFWSITLAVGPGVLIPRPDSETLLDAAVAHAGHSGAPARILDLGTGPGTLLLAALDEWPCARGTGVERCAIAREYAARNTAALGMADRCRIIAGDWHDAAGLRATLAADGPFDLILSNPPYVESTATLARQVAAYEPGQALFAGVDGLDDYRAIMPTLPALLAPAGIAIIEIGHMQGAAVSALAQGAGMTAHRQQDLAGRDRALLCRMA
ncbi:MAG: peptide chain release factor N(5)-glutamine methyltransferase [Sphingopyxis sp.]